MLMITLFILEVYMSRITLGVLHVIEDKLQMRKENIVAHLAIPVTRIQFLNYSQ